MPDFLRATATAIANMSCCCIHISTRIAMHLPCSCVSSMETIVELRVVILYCPQFNEDSYTDRNSYG